MVENSGKQWFKFLPLYPLIWAFQALSCLANHWSWRDLSVGIKKFQFRAMWFGIEPFLFLSSSTVFCRFSVDFLWIFGNGLWFPSTFHQVCKIARGYRTPGFHIVCLFTSLFRHFRLSRVSKSIDLDETYRLVLKIINFMPCGSVLSKSSANRRQIELGLVFLELPTSFGRFADDSPTTFAGRANR